jgi:hypothetical protein
MTSPSQRKASNANRRRAALRGLVRVEVQAPKSDAVLIKALAETLRSNTPKARELRASLQQAFADPDMKNAFDIFGSDLPDEAFDGVFDAPRATGSREVEL